MCNNETHFCQQDTESKTEETRQRFRTEYLQESSDRYDSRDVYRLMKDDDLVEGYLTWRLHVVEDALKMIDDSFLWRKEYCVNDLTESCIPKWMFETGAVYLHGYDKEGNKLFWFKVKLHIKDAKTILDKKKYVAFWLERYSKQEPGKPLTVVFDMSESGLSNIDMDFVKYIINCFKVYYPKFLSKMIMYEMPWIMNAAWKIVKTWLGPEAISKLKFVSKSDVQTYISPEHLPPHMGGTDPFKYSYPPLPDDDFQSPISDNGPVVSEEENESKDTEPECKESLDSSFSSDLVIRPKKVNFSEDLDRGDSISRTKWVRKPQTTFKGTLINISARLTTVLFMSTESDNSVLYFLLLIIWGCMSMPVSACMKNPSLVSWIVSVCLCAGFQASPQDRFLIMAAEMEQSAGAGSPELAQFWKEVPKTKIMEHRCLIHPQNLLYSTFLLSVCFVHQLMQVMASNCRLEKKLDMCLWVQKVLLVLVSFIVAFSFSALYLMWTS
uniref:CRAL-TRIO domain-containing protein n=1 Tax=Denticeps clupeoides TaxID=299321 RepID=A0AAY4DS50_9TELE